MWLLLVMILLSCGYAFGLSFFNLLGLSPWFWFLWAFLGILLAVITFGIFLLIFLEVASRTKPTGKFRHKFLYQIVLWIKFFTNCHIEIEGKENIPSGTYVMYANHKSMMDPVLLYYAIHGIVSAAGKSTLFTNHFMKNLGNTFGVFEVNREDDKVTARNLINAIKQVKEGFPMMIFPEGGIKSRETEKMVDLKPGAYKLATKAKAPIVPVTIIGSTGYYKKPLFKRVNIKIIIHEPITEEVYSTLNTTDLGLKVESIINGDINE